MKRAADRRVYGTGPDPCTSLALVTSVAARSGWTSASHAASRRERAPRLGRVPVKRHHQLATVGVAKLDCDVPGRGATFQQQRSRCVAQRVEVEAGPFREAP